MLVLNRKIEEEFRQIKSSLKYLLEADTIRSLAITSCKEGEGKSFTCVNLALSLAKKDKKILVLDCNFKNPILHKCFDVKNNNGICEILKENCSIDDAIEKISENLHIIPYGNDKFNEIDVLDFKNIDELIDYLKLSYDLVIVDTPAIFHDLGSVSLCEKMDGTILVVRSEKTKKETILDGKKILDEANVNIIGSILNKASFIAEVYYHHKSIKYKNRKSKIKHKV